MGKISIFNYEAYYLDYIEGNLSEEDTALLLAFLEANPDLKLDDEDFDLSVEPEGPVLDSKSKQALLQYGEEDAVTLETIEFFMIAAKEGTLNPAKKAEVLAFLNLHPALQSDWKIYQHASLEADLSIRYSDKEALKQKTRVLWPYLSFAAAASVAALIMFWPGSGIQSSETGLGFQAGNIRSGTATGLFALHVRENNGGSDLNPVVNTQQGAESNDFPQNTVAQNTTQRNHQQEKRKKPVNQLDYRPAGNVSSLFNNLELQPIAKTTFTQDSNPVNSTQPQHYDVADARNLEMHNPIEPITKFVSEKTHTDIDFRKTEKGAEGKKGFYLKIGKFEISRKKH